MKFHLLYPLDRASVEELRAKASGKLTYVKLSVLVLLDEGLTQEMTANLLGISAGTVNSYKQKYEQEGLSRYLTTNYKPYEGKLSDEQLALLETEVQNGLYTTSAQVAAWITQQFEVSYSDRTVREILSKLDFVYKKTSILPSKADPVEQELFLKNLPTFWEEVELATDEVLYYMDAVHPQHNTRSDYAWIKRGEEKAVPSNPGRERININAAMNAHQPEDVVIVEAKTINAQATQALYEKLEAMHPDQEIIWIIADNAKYYLNAELQKWLTQHPKIQPIHLPTYSPNLNLIERLWKFMRKKVINLHFYPKFKEFREAVLGFFQNIAQYKRELTSLMQPNFQRFSVQPKI